MTGAKSALDAVVKYQQLVTDRQHCRAVGDQDNNGPARLGVPDRLEQGCFPVAVEIGVRLVEHDQKRIAVQCPSQRHPLALAG